MTVSVPDVVISLDSDTLLTFIRRIHATPLDRPSPSQLLDDLSAELGGAYVAVTRFLRQPFDVESLVTTTMPKVFRQAGREFYPDGFPWLAIGEANPGEFLNVSEHFSAEEMRSSAIYQRWTEPQGLRWDAIMGSLYPAGTEGPGFGWLVVGRRPFSEGEYAFCRALDPHLAQATRTAWRLHLVEQERQVAMFALEGSPEGVCFLNAAGKVCWANRAAFRTFEEADGLSLEDDRLCAASPSERGLLNQAIETCLGSADRSPGLVSLRRPSGLRALGLVMARPLREESITHQAETVAVVCILDTFAALHTPGPVLRGVYGLTGAESRLAVAIAGGTSLAEFAKRSRRSPETVRTQLKAIFR